MCAEGLPFCSDDEALQSGDFYSFCVAPLFYEAAVKDSIRRYKFHNMRGYRRTYGSLLAECVDAHTAGQFDLITWVPVSRKRLRKRGYDQAELLARETAPYLDKPLIPTLQKMKDVAAQSSIGGREARKVNIAGAYVVLDPAAVSGKRVLLMDDVLTTGSTLSECARMLLLAGATEVLCATIARAPVWEEKFEAENAASAV